MNEFDFKCSWQSESLVFADLGIISQRDREDKAMDISSIRAG
jgi:hypothetical protein